ncbi:MAG TPA: hypothetical protein VGW74_09345 [Propionibacteriaceae bacterium]|nr:hypothetical protein [Propionibacteriaceae bacterium]
MTEVEAWGDDFEMIAEVAGVSVEDVAAARDELAAQLYGWAVRITRRKEEG